jgi:hypothetical protein
MNLNLVVLEAIIALGSITLFIGSFRAKFRNPERWMIRITFFLIGPIGLAHTALDLYLTYHKNALSHSLWWSVEHLKWIVGGIALGFLFTLLLNPEFYRLSRWRRLKSD